MAVTNFVWDVENDSYLMETDGSGQTQAVYTNEPTQYGRLVSQERGTATHYYHSDVVGSTRQLTDANEATTDSYDYTAFGESVAQSGSTTNPFRFWGQFGGYSDAELANEVYIRRRNYLTSEGRWGSVDLLEAWMGYLVSGNDPIQSMVLPGAMRVIRVGSAVQIGIAKAKLLAREKHCFWWVYWSPGWLRCICQQIDLAFEYHQGGGSVAHCMATCMIQKKCGHILACAADLFGSIVEFSELDETSIGDMLGNHIGLLCALRPSFFWNDRKVCERCCKKHSGHDP